MSIFFWDQIALKFVYYNFCHQFLLPSGSKQAKKLTTEIKSSFSTEQHTLTLFPRNVLFMKQKRSFYHTLNTGLNCKLKFSLLGRTSLSTKFGFQLKLTPNGAGRWVNVKDSSDDRTEVFIVKRLFSPVAHIRRMTVAISERNIFARRQKYSS
jgi:hypothetical protein